MELRHLKYFLAITRQGSFTKASEQLFVTQPTLSHQIRQLEIELGCELFDRSSRNVRLTGAGEIFAIYANQAIKEIEDGKEAIQAYQGLQMGGLTIGAISAFTNSLLPSILLEFTQMYPGIKVRVVELPSEEMQMQIRDGELSFGLGYGPELADLIHSQELFQEDLMLIVSKRHALAKASHVQVDDLATVRLALLPHEYATRKLIDVAFLRATSKPNVSLEMNSIDALLTTIADSNFATIMPKRMIQHYKKLVAISIHPEITRTATIFSRKNANLSPAAKILVNMLIDRYRKTPFADLKSS